MINLAIVSDIRLYREGLGRILNEVDEINVVDVVESHNEILKLLEVNRLNMILLDMRTFDNCKVLTSITKNFVNTKIIVIAVPENDDNFLLCAESGIAGYLTKKSTIEELVDAIKTVDKGGLYCPSSITEYILNSIKHKHDDNQINEINLTYSKLLNILTQRETH